MISEPFATMLAAGRAQFNQRALEARRRFPAFDAGTFADFLKSGVDAVVGAVAAAVPQRVPAVALVAYDIALELTGLALVGPKARSGLVEQTWRTLGPCCARLIAKRPAETLGALTNAVIYLESVDGTRPAQWLQEMAAIAPDVDDLAQLQAVGQILAWRAGVAHFRVGALQAADALPERLALAAVGASPAWPWSQLRQRMLADPWHVPDGAARPASREHGGFTGFGGLFPVPPQARARPDGFAVSSGGRYYLLIADAFGAVLHAATKEEFDHADANPVALKGRQVAPDLPAIGLAVCGNEYTIAVTSPYTHAIRLLPRL
jgi:hypothetical protein